MIRKLKQVRENGQLVWRITDEEQKIEAPCDAMKRAKEKAIKVHAELEAERNNNEGENE